MYRRDDLHQITLDEFDQPIGLHMDPNNRWIQLARFIPWEKFEHLYAGKFKSKTGNVAKPFRMALGSLIIQKKMGFSDEETVAQITENPYLQYFIGLPGYQLERPFSPSLMSYFRRRMNLDVLKVINDAVIEQDKERNASQDEDDHNNSASGGGSSDEDISAADQGSENSGTLILDATCAPSNIRFPMDASLLNEAREKLEAIIRRICKDYGKKAPRTYCRVAHQSYLDLAKSKKPSAKKIRKTIRQQLGYVRRDIGYIEGFLSDGCEMTLTESSRFQTILKVYEQQKEMFDNRTHSVKDRIVSISQPYIRPIVRGKAKAPVEFGIKFDMSVDEAGMQRVEHISFDGYNEAGYLQDAVENYKSRTGRYPERILVDQIYRTRANRRYCKEHGIRMSGPKLGRKPDKVSASEKKIAYQDNTDRIGVEREFSLDKRCYGMGLIVTKTKETTYGSIGLSVLTANLFKILRRESALLLRHFLKMRFSAIINSLYEFRNQKNPTNFSLMEA